MNSVLNFKQVNNLNQKPFGLSENGWILIITYLFIYVFVNDLEKYVNLGAGLKAEEKLINLGSRNFFLCSKPIASVNSFCSEEANKETQSPFPLTKLMDFLL